MVLNTRAQIHNDDVETPRLHIKHHKRISKLRHGQLPSPRVLVVHWIEQLVRWRVVGAPLQSGRWHDACGGLTLLLPKRRHVGWIIVMSLDTTVDRAAIGGLQLRLDLRVDAMRSEFVSIDDKAALSRHEGIDCKQLSSRQSIR